MSEIPSKVSENVPQAKNRTVPIQLKDISTFDGAYTFMKERFTEEMRRIEDEMTLFSKNLLRLCNDAKTYHAGVTSDRENPSCFLETIANSPLIEGEGVDKTLKLQFDVSQFEPGEVEVRVLDTKLVVTAQHVEKSDTSVTHNHYHREFQLPAGVDPESVESTLSKDGVLTVKAPLNLSGFVVEDDDSI